MDAWKDGVRLFERQDIAQEVADALGGYVLPVNEESDPAGEN